MNFPQFLLRFTAVSRLCAGDYLSLSLCNMEQPPVPRAKHGQRGGQAGAQAVPSQHHPQQGAGISRGSRLPLCTAIPSTFALIRVGWANCSASECKGSKQLCLWQAWLMAWWLQPLAELLVADLLEPKHGSVLRASCKQNSLLCSRVFQGSSSGTRQIWENRRGDSD